MRIGIDAKRMYPGASGIGRYLIEIVKAMSLLPGSMEHEFILYPGSGTIRLQLPPNWKYSESTMVPRATLRALVYHLITKKDRLDLFYSADFIGPVFRMPCRTVVTVHDLIPIVYPRLTSFKHRLVGRLLLPPGVKKASSVIAVSHSTKNDIIKYINMPGDKIKVIYEGRNNIFRKRTAPGQVSDIRKKYRIGDKLYIMFLGYVDPRKNIQNIIKAFSLVEGSIREKSLLVLCGNINKENQIIRRLIKKNRLEDKIIFTGFVPDEDLSALYNGARAFCFPSLYEGFGLPVLEAMACGCPVITSNISSLPEVAGDAAILVNPDDAGQISAAMSKLLTDNTLYIEMQKKGLKQAEKFSWETAAGKLLDIFNSIKDDI